MVGSVLSNAFSGLNTASKRLQVSANNIANVQTVGRISANPSDNDEAFHASTVIQTALPGGGTHAIIRPITSPIQPVFNPSSPLSNDDGLIAAPNVNLANEAVEQISARVAFAANAAIIRSEDEKTESLLDILS